MTIERTADAYTLPADIPEGVVQVTFNNASEQPVDATFARLNEGVTAEQYLNTPPTEIPPAAGLGGITGIATGMHQYLSLTLEPGNYAMMCFFLDPASAAPHFILGMVYEFTIE